MGSMKDLSMAEAGQRLGSRCVSGRDCGSSAESASQFRGASQINVDNRWKKNKGRNGKKIVLTARLFLTDVRMRHRTTQRQHKKLKFSDGPQQQTDKQQLDDIHSPGGRCNNNAAKLVEDQTGVPRSAVSYIL